MNSARKKSSQSHKIKGLAVDPYSLKDINPLLSSWDIRAQDLQAKGLIEQDLYTHFLLMTKWYGIYYDKRSFERIKRLSDLCLGIILAFAALPVMAIAALAIKLSSPGPVFFFQPRVGQFGTIFLIFKFRTMTDPSNEKHLKTWLQLKPLEKRLDDPRVTKVGRFLRKWKIDELPQLFNVIKGNMSLCGPRPLAIEDSSTCPLPYWSRLAVRPGMTGLWQALFSNCITAQAKFRLDCLYVKKRSFWLDWYLIFNTLPRVLRGEEPKNKKNSTPIEIDKFRSKAG